MSSVLIGLYIVSSVCLWVLLSAILLNFYFSRKEPVRREKKSIVETGTMLAFFIGMVLIVYLDIGFIGLDEGYRLAAAAFGTFLIVSGTAVNIAGRLRLKGNWGNQIRIYDHHTLVTTGIYHHIRHPLYSSTILMLVGFAFLFQNYIVLMAVLAIFVPFMIYRARQEDRMLLGAFNEEFDRYRARTGLFIPRIRK